MTIKTGNTLIRDRRLITMFCHLMALAGASSAVVAIFHFSFYTFNYSSPIN